MAETTSTTRRLQPATIALALAALIAVGVLVYTLAFRKDGASGAAEANGAAPANATAAAGQAPSVETLLAGLVEQVRRNPDDHEGWFRLGMAYRNMEDIRQASVAFRRAMELQPRSADYNNFLAETLLITATRARQPAPPEAETLLRTALQAAPGNAMSRFYLATIKDDRGDHRGAIDDLIALLRNPPEGRPLPPQVRRSVIYIAGRANIDISGRLPPEPAPRADGAELATAGIPGPTQDQLRAASGMTPSQQNEMGRSMVERLAGRLRQNPRDARGWIMLMRSRMALSEPQLAAEALRTGLAAFPGDTATQGQLRQAAQALGVPGA
jgi:cytochrome c-type biogenesis protein CcmH